MCKKTIRFLSAQEVRQCLPMAEAVAAMKSAFIQLSTNKARVPQRMKMEMPETGGDALFMPVHLPDERRLGLKVVTLFPDNPKKDLPVIHALVMVLDGENGAPLAVMDGEVLTALRTGAASGLATALLASKSVRCAAVVGAGVQGRTQLEGVCAVRSVERALVLDQDQARAEAFAARMERALGLPVRPVRESAALCEADVICTATPAASPVLEDRDIPPGCHINAVGSYRPDMCEIPPATVARARVVMDSLESCLEEAGDLIQPLKAGRIDKAHLGTELGAIAAGLQPGRMSREEITLFKSVGNAVQDLAAAIVILDRAEKTGLGTEVAL